MEGIQSVLVMLHVVVSVVIIPTVDDKIVMSERKDLKFL